MNDNQKMERVILGAGDFYVAPWESGAIDLDDVAVAGNLIGNTSGGATLTYTPELKTIEDDMGRVRKTFMSKANAELKTGLLTYTLSSLKNLMSYGKYSEDVTSGKRVLELGGGKAALKKMCVVFVYTDDETGLKTRIGIIATNTAALTMAFTKDTETVPDITFAAESNGIDDTIVVIDEDLPDGAFVLTEDTTITTQKTYYKLENGEYTEVSNPTGNPKSQGWYEKYSRA